ncbi:MAG: GIY-YIG nuclease family protein [Patescibacteria group bacterium]|nr:GIY-YIG nuclease family protein [Patescibacteria group bacterium]
MHFVYILQSEQYKFYYHGSTSDINRRLQQHHRGECVTTSRGGPWKLIWYAGFSSKKLAEDFERYLKSGSGFAFSRKRLI